MIFNHGLVSHRRRTRMGKGIGRIGRMGRIADAAPLELEGIFVCGCYKHVAPMALGRGDS